MISITSAGITITIAIDNVDEGNLAPLFILKLL